MESNLNLSKNFEEQIKQLILSATKSVLEQTFTGPSQKEWMSITEGAKYAGVSYNTFMKFRVMGLRVSEIDGIKRVSLKEINRFLEDYSF